MGNDVERWQLDTGKFEWHNLKIYVASLQTLLVASDLMVGESYNTASPCHPFPRPGKGRHEKRADFLGKGEGMGGLTF